MTDEPFQVPLPLPFPPRLGGHDVVFFRHELGADAEGREHEDIMLRRVPREVAGHFRAGAGGRGLTHAQYLAALVELHRRVRELVDGGDERVAQLLDELRLATVTV